MDATLKVLKEYATWKNNLKKVLDKNLDEIIDLIVDAGGYNTLIPFKTIEQSNLLSYTSPPQEPLIYPNSSQAHATNPIQIQQAFIINFAPQSTKRIIWFFTNQRFFLINPDTNTPLNTYPIYQLPLSYSPLFTNGNFISTTENQIEFVLALLDWLPKLQTLLTDRISSMDPNNAASQIKNFYNAINANDAAPDKAHTE